MTDLENAGMRLKTARMAAGFRSAKEFCDKYNIISSTYSLHETGGRNLKLKIAQKYAEFLGINIAWLLTGSGTPYKSNELIEEKTISQSQFSELLKYQGNKNIHQKLSYKNELLHNVNPVIFCKIVTKMIGVLNKYSFHLELEGFAKKASETYKDITSSSDNPEIQLSMVDLSITTFSRQIQDAHMQEKKVVNK